MPAIYWLPFAEVSGPVPVEHLHAAFSHWFDTIPARDNGPDDDPHHATVKPYRLAPVSKRGGGWGMEASVLTEDAFRVLAGRIAAGAGVRLGRLRTTVGTPIVLQGESWADLAEWSGETAWRVEFLTPFISRTGNRSSPFPAPQVVLRAATDAWAQFSGHPPLRVAPVDHAQLWVSALDVSTTGVMINGHRHPGAVGHLVYRAAEPRVAAAASSLFRLAAYCGMGSFRGKGMGIVRVDAQ